MNNDSSTHTSRWKERRAIRSHGLSKQANAKNSNPVSEAEWPDWLPVYSDEEAKSKGEIGILADINYPFYSLLYKGSFIEGKAERGVQSDILKLLVVGDMVIFESSGEAISIKGVLQRHSKIARLYTDSTKRQGERSVEKVIAANIDIGVIVASTTQPQFNLRLIDRYMVICEYGNVKPLLCITKIDLEKSPGLPMYDGSNMPIVEVSNKTKEGIEKLKELLKGKACVFLGSSGVGKSSLINTMFGKEILEVGEISRKSGMGMHTTSSASLHLFKGDTVLIDTPGIRSLSLGNIDENSLKTYFHEFEEYAPQCEFSDCTHSHEPKCAVKEAVENGKIPKWRYDTYIRILDDIRREKK